MICGVTAFGARSMSAAVSQYHWITSMPSVEAAIRDAATAGAEEVFIHARHKLVSQTRMDAIERALWQAGFGTERRGTVSDYRIMRIYWNRFLSPQEAERLAKEG